LLELFQNVIGVRFFFETQCIWWVLVWMCLAVVWCHRAPPVQSVQASCPHQYSVVYTVITSQPTLGPGCETISWSRSQSSANRWSSILYVLPTFPFRSFFSSLVFPFFSPDQLSFSSFRGKWITYRSVCDSYVISYDRQHCIALRWVTIGIYRQSDTFLIAVSSFSENWLLTVVTK